MNMYIFIQEYVYITVIPRIWTAIKNALQIKNVKYFFKALYFKFNFKLCIRI